MKLSRDLCVLGTPLLGLVVLGGARVEAAFPQDIPAPPAPQVELPSPRKIVDRYLDVTGTAKFAPKYRSQKTTGTVELVGMGITGTTETITMKPSYMLTTFEMTGFGKVLTGDNGKVAWRIQPMMGEQLLEGAELAQMRLRNTPFESALKKEAYFDVMETVGEEAFGDKRCYKLRFVEKPYKGVEGDPQETIKLREYFEFYEIETGLLAGMKMTSVGPQGNIPSTITLSDYKKFGEILEPTSMRFDVPSMKILTKTTSIEFNTIEDVKVFALPPEIEALVEDQDEDEEGEHGDEDGHDHGEGAGGGE